MPRDLDKQDVVRVTKGKMKGKTGVIVRAGHNSSCVILTKVWDHGIWFSNEELKRCGKVKAK